MAELQFELVSPERSLASLQVTEVQLPGTDGDMTAMADHAPVITTLRPGMVRAVSSAGATEYFVTGGFAEVTATGTTVLAEKAYEKGSEGARAAVEEQLELARKKLEEAEGDHRDTTEKVVADFVQLLENME